MLVAELAAWLVGEVSFRSNVRKSELQVVVIEFIFELDCDRVGVVGRCAETCAPCLRSCVVDVSVDCQSDVRGLSFRNNANSDAQRLELKCVDVFLAIRVGPSTGNDDDRAIPQDTICIEDENAIAILASWKEKAARRPR